MESKINIINLWKEKRDILIEQNKKKYNAGLLNTLDIKRQKDIEKVLLRLNNG